ncbi:acyl-CoA oxidase [Burkholderia phage BcepSauron]|uniref:Acyl-CoA oxidase n=1 Tax=Burkholderia phage BcepSauron TaxID=2530033 RepID=A0A482MLV0_9CAUD|nr:acyl-CoA oxidase [Burkholderia phage BcepSauron]QBQ74628.1 acyl-CoA oxidase [Burkholderia phage BcepSauron]
MAEKKKPALTIEEMMGFDLRDKTDAVPKKVKKDKTKVKRAPALDIEDVEAVEIPVPKKKKRGRPPEPRNDEMTRRERDRDAPAPSTALEVIGRDPLEDDEDDMALTAVKKKKHKESDEDSGNRISRLKSSGLNSILGDDAEKLQQLLEDGDADSAANALQKRMLQTCIDLIAEVENGVRESKGRYGVHSFNNLIMSIRELMTDMQQTKDRGAIGLTISETVLRPLLLDIAMMIMNETAAITAAVKPLVSLDDFKEFRKEIDEVRARTGAFMQSSYAGARDRIIEFMQR